MLINKRYEIQEKIGQGSIGEVFKAYDTYKEKIVAIKIAKPEPTAEDKLINEFKITSQFEHPNIISAFDFGIIRSSEDDKYINRKFIVFEHCDIYDIVNFFSKLDFKKKIEMIIQITHALYLIHKSGYIHRDIKPENILYDSKNELVKISDLGLAVELDEATSGKMPAGTLLYIAPEILRGDKFDQSADIYSLGILIYHLLKGHPPFESENPIEIIKWHLSKKKLDDKEINTEFIELLNSMIDPDPSQRPKNMLDVLNRLKNLTPDFKPSNNFKIRKPIGKSEAIKKASEILKNLKISPQETKIILISGADGLGKTSLTRYINVEAKTLGFETITINELNIQKIINLITNSPLILNLTPELRLQLEKFKDITAINPHISIEFSQFLKRLIFESSSSFPVALFFDDLNPNELNVEVFLKSFLQFDESSGGRMAIFITCNNVNFYTSFIKKLETIYLRPLNVDEIKEYIMINFDFDDESATKFAKVLAEYTGGISAIVEIFSNYLSKIRANPNLISQIAKIKFDEILNQISHLSKTQKRILEILSLGQEPVEIKILNEFFCENITLHLNELQRSGFIKIENEKISISYMALKNYIDETIDPETRRKIHLNYAIIYLNQPNWEENADKILHHFVKAKDKTGIEKFAEKGIEKLIFKNEFKKAIDLCVEIFELLPDYLKETFTIKLADLNLKIGNYSETINILHQSDDLQSLEMKSQAYFHRGETGKAMEILKNAFVNAETPYEKVRVAVKLSQIYASSGEIENAFLILKSFESEKIIKLLAKTETLGDFYAGLGITSQMKGLEKNARRYFELSLEQRLSKKDNRKAIAGYNNIANFYSIIGQHDEAIKYWKKALEISESIGDIIQNAHIYNNIGISHFKRRNFEKAVENYQKALSIYKTLNDVPGMANALGNIAEVLIEEFKLAEAYENINEAKKLHELSKNQDGICEANFLLLSLYLNIGDLNSAELILNEISEKCPNLPKHWLDFQIAILEMKKKNFDRAESMLAEIERNELVRREKELHLKILISMLKLSYVSEQFKLPENIELLLKLADDRVSKSMIFFLLALLYESKDKMLAFRYLNESTDELRDEFAEFRWKLYLKIAEYYKNRGIDVKFLQYFEQSLLSFDELIRRIKIPKFVKAYVEDVENEKFYNLLKKIKCLKKN